MKTYEVSVPMCGNYIFNVIAKNEQEAKEKVLDGKYHNSYLDEENAKMSTELPTFSVKEIK